MTLTSLTGWGPPYVGEMSTYFMCANRNKRSVAIDLKSHEGQQVIHDLVEKSDVFVENYLPGKLQEYNLHYEALREVNPGLIYASISGFGQSGPSRNKPGYDVVMSGMQH